MSKVCDRHLNSSPAHLILSVYPPRSLSLRQIGLALLLPALAIPLLGSNFRVAAAPSTATATKSQPVNSQALTLRADVQEANARTGVVVARGNVQINYPARQIQATSAQAMFYSKERRIELVGNVYVLQQGNSLRGERITYLIDEGRFIATPQESKQVESIYLVNDAPAPTTPAPAAVRTPSPAVTSPFPDKPQFSPAMPVKP